MPPRSFLDTARTVQSHMHGELSVLYRSQVSVVFVDVPAAQVRIARRNSQAFQLFMAAIVNHPSLLASYSFDQILRNGRRRPTRDSRALRRREDYMLSSFEPAVHRLLADRPNLAEAKTIRVLFNLGTAHTRISHELDRRGYITRRIFAQRPLVFDHYWQAQRAAILGRPIDDTLLARAILTNCFYRVVLRDRLSVDMRAVHAMCRTVMGGLSVNDIEHVLRSYWKGTPGENRGEVLARIFSQELGIALPTTDSELDRFVSAL